MIHTITVTPLTPPYTQQVIAGAATLQSVTSTPHGSITAPLDITLSDMSGNEIITIRAPLGGAFNLNLTLNAGLQVTSYNSNTLTFTVEYD